LAKQFGLTGPTFYSDSMNSAESLNLVKNPYESPLESKRARYAYLNSKLDGLNVEQANGDDEE
jgi:hypothetical protein